MGTLNRVSFAGAALAMCAAAGLAQQSQLLVWAPRRFHQDNRIWWIIQDGQIRFSVEGQEPFVASKGFMVQVPHRNVYSMETVGDKPSLRFEVTVANSNVMYPIDET